MPAHEGANHADFAERGSERQPSRWVANPWFLLLPWLLDRSTVRELAGGMDSRDDHARRVEQGRCSKRHEPVSRSLPPELPPPLSQHATSRDVMRRFNLAY